MKNSKLYLSLLLLSFVYIILIFLPVIHAAEADDAISAIIRASSSQPAIPPDTDPVIVDNTGAEFRGDWEKGNTSEDKFRSDYMYIEAGDGSAKAVFRPQIPASGLYELYEWHPEGDNRTSEAEIVIQHADGSSRLNINQKNSGGSWNLLGRFAFSAGSDNYVMITNHFSSSTGDVVLADAFQFVPVTSGEGKKSAPQQTRSQKRRIRPFGEYVKEVIGELEARKAREKKYAGYLMKDKWKKYTGVTQTLSYQGTSYMWNECKPGERVKFSNGRRYYPYGKSYCSGLTLEIFHRAMKKRDRDMGIPDGKEDWNGLGPKGIFILKKIWNVINIRYEDTGQRVTRRPSPARALELSGLGYVVTEGDESKFDNVRKYDFCDISRSSNTGHSVIFIKWIRDSRGRRIGFQYYSTQKSTDGQGYNTEYFKGYRGGKVLKRLFNAGRVYDNPKDWTENRIREADYK